jgi:two-component system KDP operon response regulator KdpE
MAKKIKKILVVEDNDSCRELLALLIKRLGYEVIEAATGLEALERASTLCPDLIMMDLGLPEMAGDKATACLKANPATREIPVIINTAYARGPQTKRALQSGAVEVLHKPFAVTALRDVLCRYLSAADETITGSPQEVEPLQVSIRSGQNLSTSDTPL